MVGHGFLGGAASRRRPSRFAHCTALDEDVVARPGVCRRRSSGLAPYVYRDIFDRDLHGLEMVGAARGADPLVEHA